MAYIEIIFSCMFGKNLCFLEIYAMNGGMLKNGKIDDDTYLISLPPPIWLVQTSGINKFLVTSLEVH